MTTAHWAVTYADGRCLTDEEITWDEIAQIRTYGLEALSVLREPAAQLSAFVGGRSYTLRAPDGEARFFRRYRGRIAFGGGPTTYLCHEIGYVWRDKRIWFEIDPKGNVTSREIYAPQPL